MTEIGFYIVRADKPDAPEVLVCRLVEKAYDLGLSLFVHTSSEYQTKKVDDLLWVFNQRSFIPHAKNEDNDAIAPVNISRNQPTKPADMLINMADEVPNFFTNFKRMAEIVPVGKKPQGRKRYKFYSDRGYEIKLYRV